VLLPAVALLACDRARRADMPWKLCGTMAIGCLISLAIGAGPFYARNTVMTGNPLFPHSTGMFQTKAGLPRLPFDRLPAGSKGLIDFSYGGFTDRFGMGREIEDLLLAPWNVIMHGHFHTEKYPLKYFDGQLNPLILLFGLLLVAYAFGARMTDPTGGSGSDEAARSEPDYRALLAVTGLLMGFWLLGSHQVRFLLPLVTLLSWSVTGMIRGGSMRRAMFWILIGIVSCTWTVSYGLNRIARVAPYLSGDQTSERYLAAKLPFYACFDWANRSLSGDGIILVLLEERTFLLRRPYLWTGLLPHTFINFLHACGTAAEAERLLRERGIEYVFLPRHAAVLYANIDNALFQTIRREFFQERLETIYSDAQCALLSWKTR
nr:hypothetical protein [Candidatus Ozemobacteraceae bacterium]